MRVKFFRGVILRDQIVFVCEVGYYIVNLNDLIQFGLYWVVIYVKNDRRILEYFDSFGLNVLMELVDLLDIF